LKEKQADHASRPRTNGRLGGPTERTVDPAGMPTTLSSSARSTSSSRCGACACGAAANTF
jgi:hypothetical protein